MFTVTVVLRCHAFYMMHSGVHDSACEKKITVSDTRLIWSKQWMHSCQMMFERVLVSLSVLVPLNVSWCLTLLSSTDTSSRPKKWWWRSQVPSWSGESLSDSTTHSWTRLLTTCTGTLVSVYSSLALLLLLSSLLCLFILLYSLSFRYSVSPLYSLSLCWYQWPCVSCQVLWKELVLCSRWPGR